MALQVIQGATTVTGSGNTSTIQAGLVTAQLAVASLVGSAPGSYAWTLSIPPTSSAALSATTVAAPSFTPDVAGIYTLTLNGTYSLPLTVTSTVPNVYQGPVVPGNILPSQAPVPAQGSSIISDSTTPASLLATDVNGNHAPLMLARSGATGSRPNGGTVGLFVGFPYFDTTLHYLVVWDGAVWRNGAGASV